MNHFAYKNNVLHCEDVSVAQIAKEVGTPVYIYSSATLTRHFQVFDKALEGIPHIICFSVKANSNLAVLNLLFQQGAGADIVSGGELFRVQRAGGSPKKVVFSGVGKTRAEMEQALRADILAFNVESQEELRALNEVAGQLGKRAPVSLRVNPDVDAQTHPYISTGLKKNKFGVAKASAREVYRYAKDLPHIEIVGVDCHIGSQLTNTSPFVDAAERLVVLVDKLRQDGIAIQYLDVGGGLGIPYGEDGEPTPPSPAEYGAALRKSLAPLIAKNITIICEPGRVIAGNAGALITQVLYHKQSEIKHFTIVDAAFNDLLRPAFYESFHPMQPVEKKPDRPQVRTDIVGPICETGDFLARDREMARVDQGEWISVGASGAYGFTMASNYNTRPRAAEVLVRQNQFQIVRKRETLEQLVENETIPTWK